MICEVTGKHSLSRSDAQRKVSELMTGDPAAALLNAYKCAYCNRWHVGHRRDPADITTPPRRLNL